LLKDEGKGKINGRDVHKLGLKPKTSRRSLFLKDEVFSLTRAEIALDTETKLPLKITYYPGRSEQLRFASGQGNPIYVEYSDFGLNTLSGSDLKFSPSGVDKVFEERQLDRDEFETEFPLTLNLDEVEEEGFSIVSDKITVTENAANDKAYTSVGLLKSSDGRSANSSSLQLHAGNYLSREMSRHRSFLSDHGEDVDLDGTKGKVVNRGNYVRDQLPEGLNRDILEVGWEDGGEFYYMVSQDVGQEELVTLCKIIKGKKIIDPTDM